MTPVEMHEMLLRMQAQAAQVPAAVQRQASTMARQLNGSRNVRAAVKATETGATLRVASTNARLSTAAVAQRVGPTLVKNVDRAIRSVIRA